MSEEKVRKIKASGLPRMKMPEQDPVRRASNLSLIHISEPTRRS